MHKTSRITGLILLLLGTMSLLSGRGKPGIEALDGSDVVSLVAAGVCFGVAVVGLLGQLRLQKG